MQQNAVWKNSFKFRPLITIKVTFSRIFARAVVFFNVTIAHNIKKVKKC